MDNQKLLSVMEHCETKPNAELQAALQVLETEFTETKKMLLLLSTHLDTVEQGYNKISGELKKRMGK